MTALRSPWLLASGSLLFLAGSVAFLNDDTSDLGAWLFVVGSAMFLAHALGAVLDRRRG